MQGLIQFTIVYEGGQSDVQEIDTDSIAKLRAAASAWLDANGITGSYSIRFE